MSLLDKPIKELTKENVLNYISSTIIDAKLKYYIDSDDNEYDCKLSHIANLGFNVFKRISIIFGRKLYNFLSVEKKKDTRYIKLFLSDLSNNTSHIPEDAITLDVISIALGGVAMNGPNMLDAYLNLNIIRIVNVVYDLSKIEMSEVDCIVDKPICKMEIHELNMLYMKLQKEISRLKWIQSSSKTKKRVN